MKCIGPVGYHKSIMPNAKCFSIEMHLLLNRSSTVKLITCYSYVMKLKFLRDIRSIAKREIPKF